MDLHRYKPEYFGKQPDEKIFLQLRNSKRLFQDRKRCIDIGKIFRLVVVNGGCHF